MILDFGHIYIELTLEIPSLAAGDTITARHTSVFPGGRTLNQSIAAARSGAKVSVTGTIGDDLFGKEILHRLAREGILTTSVAKAKGESGILTTIKNKNSQSIHIHSLGANIHTTSAQIPRNAINFKSLVLLQDEMPPDENLHLLERARENSAISVLNSSLKNLGAYNDIKPDFIILRDSMKQPDVLRARAGCIALYSDAKDKILTLNAHIQNNQTLRLAQVHHDNFYTTFAQDCFVGSFAACIQAGLSIPESLHHGFATALLAGNPRTDKQDKFPYLDEIESFKKTLPRPENL